MRTLRIAVILLLATAIAKAQMVPLATTQPTTSTAVEPAALPNVPVHFARSGREIAIEQPLTFNRLIKAGVLRAFDRTWTEPFAVGGSGMVLKMKVTVPEVRVPTVFSVTWPEPPYIPFAELVAYPERSVDWDKKITLYSCGTPAWFDQWAQAVGLPVKHVAQRELPSAKLAPDEEGGKSLLILGTEDKNLFTNKKTNVLVLEAGWFGDAAGPVSVAPSQMLGGLSEIATQNWAKPLAFSSCRKPWSGIANRWAWIVDDAGLPLVEEIRVFTWDERQLFPPASKEDVPTLDGKPEADAIARLVASYMPWQQQLGRHENADAVLLTLMQAIAGASPRELDWSPVEIAHPPGDQITKEQRPVLWAMRTGRLWASRPHAKPEYVGPINVIVDLRGAKPVIGDRLHGGAKQLAPDNRQPSTRAIILGDDGILDEWGWLKLDRKKKHIGRAGVQWLPADELPPSKDNQIRLMLKLTELGVPLAPR